MEMYSTTNITLAAFLLSSLPASTFTVENQKNSFQKIIKLFYSETQQELIRTLVNDYLNKKAKVDLYSYGRKLNLLRDAIKEVDRG